MSNFRCVFCGQGGMNWILSTNGHVICDSCGMKQPPAPDALRTPLEQRVGVLEDKVRALHKMYCRLP